MYVKKMCGYVISVDMPYALKKGLLDSYSPPTQESIIRTGLPFLI